MLMMTFYRKKLTEAKNRRSRNGTYEVYNVETMKHPSPQVCFKHRCCLGVSFRAITRVSELDMCPPLAWSVNTVGVNVGQWLKAR